MKRLLITIDGPGGAGKTTLSRLLAARLGYRYIDTGALYRGIALAVKNAKIDSDCEEKIGELCEKLEFNFIWAEAGLRLICNGEDISDRIRTPEISMLASAVSAKPVVRRFLLDLQRSLATAGGTVFEGRDMGTVVFPRADIKFFLDASLKTRALRRYKELVLSADVSFEAVENDMRRRDENDSSRALAPLKPAQDAVMIDSSGLSIEKVLDRMLSRVKEKNEAAA